MKQNDQLDADSKSFNPSLQQNRTRPLKVGSNLLSTYRETMSPKPIDILDSIKLFQKAGIIYNPYKQFSSFKYKLLNDDKSEQILTLRSQIGPFEMELEILLNLEKANPFQDISQSSKGNYGHIYFLSMDGIQIAFKIIPRKEQISIKSSFSRLIREITIMKIASALQCSVRMEKYLGFDAIIYTNQYMFAMEMGMAINRLCGQIYSNLKGVIETLHSYGIIHFDIKPQNVMYSPYYSKAVFIDFGFSDVVKEKVGQKTFTSFRGTPKYCGEEILGIFVNHNIPSYVDVYYNDLFAFQQTIQTLKYKSIEVERKQMITALDGPYQTQMQELLIELQMQYYVFQYCYLFRKHGDMIRILGSRQKRLYKYKIRDILAFMIKAFSIVFHQKSFQQLKQWKYLDEYQQMQRKIQAKTSKLSYFCSHHFIVKTYQDQQKFSPPYKFRLNISQQDNFNIENSFSFHIISRLKTNILPQKGKISNRDYEILFYYLRFDIKNLSCSEKAVIAKKFKQIINESIEEDFSPPYREIKFFFKYFLRHVIVVEPLSEWQKSHFYNVIYQLIMLGVSVQSELCQFIEIMRRNQNNVTEKSIIYFEFFSVLNLILSVNLKQDTKYYYAELYKLVISTINNLKEQILKCPCRNKQQQTLIMIVKQLQIQRLENEKEQFSVLLLSQVQKITNKTLYNLLKKMYSLSYLLFNAGQCKHQHLITMVKSFSTNFGQTNLINTMVMVKRISIILQVHTELIYFNKKLREILDCQQIYNRLNFERYGFIMSRENANNGITMGYLKDINLCYDQYLAIQYPINPEINLIISKLKPSELNYEDKEILRSLFLKIEAIDQFSGERINSIMLYQKIFQKIKIMKLFANIGFKSNCLKLETTQKQVEYFTSKLISQSNQTFQQRHFIMANTFKNLLLITQYFYDQMDLRDMIMPAMKLEAIARHLRLRQIWYFTLHSIVHFANVSKEIHIFRTYIERVFELMTTTMEIGPFFFMQRQWPDLNVHLSYFAKFNLPQSLYILLKINIQWIRKNPFEAYVSIFRTNVDRFCEAYSERITFQTLNRQIPFAKISENPYIILYYVNTAYFEKCQTKSMILKFITLHLQRLSIFTQKSILIKYYYIALTLTHFSASKVNYLLYKNGKRYIQKSRYQMLVKNVEKQEEKAVKSKNVVLAKLLNHKLKYLKCTY